MDVNVKEFLDIAVLVATGISASYGVFAYKRQKEFDNAQKALEEFYIPVMKVLEKHFYNNVKLNTDSFREAKKQVKELFDSKYMFVSFCLQDCWESFLNTKDDKNKYFDFCDCFFKRVSILHKNMRY